eukprot:CAMPEP_0204150364 /NCGR_PEP_ID=MMETSP0361-20130328/25210_1 /ASSEMBLY_ACC=CAM_ASM_000343 /TAXON_ID=268821 /ORGANISM="Scrippsiella Hangoei, Strain SHTV-5" /LENGTH=108 /DNA_ID=CAMNT_0051105023 /DNA_START=50 /DNA_END=373 /DNA_ORIENTATION=+
MSAPSAVLDGLWQGGSEVLDDASWFECQRIDHVVSACPSTPGHEGLVLMHVGVKDNDSANITQHFERVVKFIHAARSSGGSIYVHCSQGLFSRRLAREADCAESEDEE